FLFKLIASKRISRGVIEVEVYINDRQVWNITSGEYDESSVYCQFGLGSSVVNPWFVCNLFQATYSSLTEARAYRPQYLTETALTVNPAQIFTSSGLAQSLLLSGFEPYIGLPYI